MSHSEEMRNALKGVRASNPPLRKKNNRRTPPPPLESPFKGRSQSGASGCRPLALPAGRRTAMPGRLRRREAGLRVCIRKAELAGLGYRESVRPLLVELRDCIARRNAPEAREGVFVPLAAGREMPVCQWPRAGRRMEKTRPFMGRSLRGPSCAKRGLQHRKLPGRHCRSADRVSVRARLGGEGMTPRETKLRAVVAQLCAVVARRVEKETAVQAAGGAITCEAGTETPQRAKCAPRACMVP